MCEDIKFDVRHFARFERLPLVGDNRWEAGMVVFCKTFTIAKVKYFDIADAGTASELIHEGVEHAACAAGE